MAIKNKLPKEKKCHECKSNYFPKYPLQKVCSIICAIKLAKKKEAELWKKEKKVLKEKLKTLQDYETEARKVFQMWINLRDINRPCVSCNTSLTLKPRNASHYFSANQFSALIFEPMNVHSSCIPCNKYLHGNLIEYRKGLILRYGETFVQDLELMAETGRNKKWTKDELIEIKNKYNKLLKDERLYN